MAILSSQSSTASSSMDQALALTLAASMMFVVGYTATRAFLGISSPKTAGIEVSTPHEAALWSPLAQS